MKNISAYATALLALVITGLFSVSASTQTLSLNDGAILRSKTNRIGLNIGSINNRDNGQILKNLIGSTNPGLEPLQDQQILVLERAGTTTKFTLPDARNNVPANYWAGGTFSVVESQSSQGEHGCSGTIESNTGVNDSRSPATGKSPVITISAPCDAPFRAGDMIILSKTAYPTPESSWESAGLGGIWGSVSGGGRLLSDTSDLCATCGTQALNLDTTPRGSSASASWHFDSDPGKIFVLMNGTYELTFWAKAAGGSPTLVASASRLTDGGFNCGSYSPKLTSTWTQYTFTCTAAETPATAPGTAQVSLKTMGGSVYLDNVSFARTSPSINNPTVLRDEVIETLQRYFGDADGASKGTFRYSLGQDGQSMTNWTEPDYAELPTAAGAASFVGPDGGGSMRLSLEDYLVICQFLGVDPYLEVPATFSVTDSANLIEFLAGPTGTTYGLRRAALGQDSPWSEVFEKIHLSFCDECWNPDFAGKNLPLRATALTSQLYLDYGERARDIFAAMRADSSYSANSFDLVMGARTAVNSSMDAAIQIAHPDSIEIDGHFYSTANRSTPDSALWKSAMVEPYAKVTNPSDPDNFSGSILDYQSQKSCGASGTADCNVQIGQWSQETLNGSIDELHLDSITARAGEGVVMALQPLLNLQYYGISPQMMLSLTQHQAASATGLTTLNGGAVDMGGATNNVRPAFLAMSLVNQSIIGPMYSCSITNNLTHDFAGSANGIYSIPATKGVPYLYAFCFENGTRRSLVLINTDLVKTHTLNFRGNNLPAGSVIQRQYAPASLDDMNESPAGQNSDNTAATVSVETSTLSSPGSITLPPHSVTALDYTAASEPMTAAPTLTPSTGAYTTPQTVTITSTAAATIYYTTDGSVPTTSSSVYSSPIAVSASQTLKAMAIASGFENSPVVTADYAISTAAPVLDATHEATAASAVAASLPTSPSSTAAKTSFATEAATTTGPVFNCPAGFVSTASSSCGVAFIGGSGPNFAVVGTNDGLNPTMSGTAVDVMPSPPGAHAALSLMYEQAVNVQAFATTYTFVPDGVNISLIFNNTNNTGSFMGSDFSAGAGCEGGFFQAFGASPNNVFSLELDSGDALTYNGTFTYSGVQVYQSQQDPCTNPYNSDYFT
ncbi:MAG: chitobiase/beta-hexosaminidase C-terminal domain-containing protein, partial [Terracidiphilus sp.]